MMLEERKLRRLRRVFECGAELIAGLAGLLFAANAFATGFFINQQSVTGIGRVNAGVTAGTDDLSAIFFNPAGLPAH